MVQTIFSVRGLLRMIPIRFEPLVKAVIPAEAEISPFFSIRLTA